MKNFISSFLFFLFFPFVISLAQEETLVGSGEIENGGFGGPVVKFTQINNEPGVLVGGRGGWIINHTFIIGGGGYGLVNNIEGNTDYFGSKPFLTFGYGGLELEYIIQSDNLIHFTINTLIGGGALTYRHGHMEDWNWDDLNFSTDEFFVLEPAVNVELNIASFCRLNAGVGYRFISGVKLDEFNNSDFDGPSGVLTIKFGSF